jgi:hypothetical protein
VVIPIVPRRRAQWAGSAIASDGHEEERLGLIHQPYQEAVASRRHSGSL